MNNNEQKEVLIARFFVVDIFSMVRTLAMKSLIFLTQIMVKDIYI